MKIRAKVITDRIDIYLKEIPREGLPPLDMFTIEKTEYKVGKIVGDMYGGYTDYKGEHQFSSNNTYAEIELDEDIAKIWSMIHHPVYKNKAPGENKFIYEINKLRNK